MAVVGLRDVKFRAAEHASGVIDTLINRIALIWEHAMEALYVWQLGYRIAFHPIHTDTGKAVVQLIIDPQILAIVGTISIRTVYVVSIPGCVLHTSIRLGAQYLFRFIGYTPAHQTIHIKHWNILENAA